MFPAISGSDTAGATAMTAGTTATAAAATATTAGVHPLASMRATMSNACIPTHQSHWLLKKEYKLIM